MLKEVEDKTEETKVSYSPCESLGYCYRHAHIVSNKVKWIKCHTTNHLGCGDRYLLRKLGSF